MLEQVDKENIEEIRGGDVLFDKKKNKESPLRILPYVHLTRQYKMYHVSNLVIN